VQLTFFSIPLKNLLIFLSILLSAHYLQAHNTAQKLWIDRCPQDWGWAVYKARSLYHALGGGFDRTWQDCFPVDSDAEGLLSLGKNVLQSSEKVDTSSSFSDLTRVIVYPVPVSELFTLSVPIGYIGGAYQIVNATGAVVDKGILTTHTQQFSASRLSNGLHFIQIRVSDKRPVTVKFVVQKL
jgi:hypothetical protein